MFCMNCGTKLPDNAKFCYNCGAKISEDLNAEAHLDSEEPAYPVDNQADSVVDLLEQSMFDVLESHFTILGKYQVELPKSTAMKKQMGAPFVRETVQLALLSQYKITKALGDYRVIQGYPVEIPIKIFHYCIMGCDSLVRKAVDFLIDHGINYVSKDDLWNMLDDLLSSTELYQTMQETMQSIDIFCDCDPRALADAIGVQMMNSNQDPLLCLKENIASDIYSDRLLSKMRKLNGRRNYPAIAYDFIMAAGFELVNQIHMLLVNKCNWPASSFETDKAESWRKNLMARYDTGKIEKEDILNGLCRCLEITEITISVYRDLLTIEPSAAKDVFRMAEAEGMELLLAWFVWLDLSKEEGVENFHFPDWMPKSISQRFYVTYEPELLIALLIELRELPQAFREENQSTTEIALIANTYWIPSDVENVEFWGMDDEVELELENPDETNWEANNVHFHLVKFVGEAKDWAQGVCQKKLREGQEALLAGDKENALQSFRLAGEMGSAEAAWQAGKLYEERKQNEDSRISLMEAAVLGNPGAAFELYRYLKEYDDERNLVYKKLAVQGAQKLEEQGKYAEARSWYEKLAAEGDGTACFYLGQLASQGKGMEQDLDQALDWYGKAKIYGCDGLESTLGALSFELGQQLEVKAEDEPWEQAQVDWQRAWHYYQLAMYEVHPGADEKIEELGLQLGKKMEQQGQDQKALAYYQEAINLCNQEATLRAARLYMNPQKEMFDMVKARSFYDKVKNNENYEAIEEEWNNRKSLVPLAKRVACFTEVMADREGEASYYYTGERLSGPLENAMKSYGRREGIQQEQVVILYDSTHSIFWGQGAQGFLITRDGQLISSIGGRISLDQLGLVECVHNEVVEVVSGKLLARLKELDSEDLAFCNFLNEIVLLPNPKKKEPEATLQQSFIPPTDETVPVSVCPQCGAAVKPGELFCGQCGSPLSSVPDGVESASANEVVETEDTAESTVEEEPTDYRTAILTFCQDFTEKYGTSNYYFRCTPNIPPKKLKNAMNSYGAQYGIQPEDVLILCDTTVFGSAKEGFLLTPERLVCNMGSFALRACEKIVPASGILESDVILMPQQVKIAEMPPSDAQTMFVQWFNALMKQ